MISDRLARTICVMAVPIFFFFFFFYNLTVLGPQIINDRLARTICVMAVPFFFLSPV